MNLHIEPLLGARRHEVAGYLSKLRLGDGEGMLSGRVPGLEPREANLLWHIEQVEDMRCFRFVEGAAHPGPGVHRVCLEVEHHRQARVEEFSDMRSYDTTQERHAAQVVMGGAQLLAIEPREPLILPDHYRSIPAPKGGVSIGTEL